MYDVLRRTVCCQNDLKSPTLNTRVQTAAELKMSSVHFCVTALTLSAVFVAQTFSNTLKSLDSCVSNSTANLVTYETTHIFVDTCI